MNRLEIRIYDETGKKITNPDLSKGWLDGGPGEQNEYSEWVMTEIYHLYTPEQLKQKQLEKEEALLKESRRPYTLEEAASIFMKWFLNDMNLPDHMSLRMKNFYPTFDEIVGHKVKMGFKFTHDGKLYKTELPDFVIPENFQLAVGGGSDKLLSEGKVLYSLIDFKPTGLIYDPIPFNNDLVLRSGNYYIQDNELYLCNKDSINPAIKPLRELVGIYVNKVTI